MDPFAEGGGLGECAARYLRWERGEIPQSASGVYGAFGAWPEEAEIRVVKSPRIPRALLLAPSNSIL